MEMLKELERAGHVARTCNPARVRLLGAGFGARKVASK